MNPRHQQHRPNPRQLRSRAANSLLASVAFAVATAVTFNSPSAPQIHAAEAVLSQHIAAQFDTLSALVEKKDFPALLLKIDTLLPSTDPESFDRALLSQVRSQVLLSFSPPRFADAIPPLETAILLGDTHGYFDASTLLDSLGTLSQLYYELSAATKDITVRRANLRQAYARIERWLTSAQTLATPPTTSNGATTAKPPTSKSTPPASRRQSAPPRRPQPSPLAQAATAHLYAATLLYTEATLDNTAPADAALLRRALTHVRQSLIGRPALDEPSLVLQLAIHQLFNQHTEAAEILEQLVQLAPTNAIYWQQLAALYAALAANADLPSSVIRTNRARALLTFDRAAQAGHCPSAMERYNRVAILCAQRQYTDAIHDLETALNNGTIENSRENWELLANLLLQERQPERAVATLEKAVNHHLPNDPQLRGTLARLRLITADTPQTSPSKNFKTP